MGCGSIMGIQSGICSKGVGPRAQSLLYVQQDLHLDNEGDAYVRPENEGKMIFPIVNLAIISLITCSTSCSN